MGEPAVLEEAPHPGPGAVPRLELRRWRVDHGVVAGLTVPRFDRAEGGAGFDLGLWTDQPVREVMERWRSFRGAEPGFAGAVLGHQAHRTEVAWHEQAAGWLVLDGVDGHATSAAGVLLLVTVADCIPVYLVDPVHRAAALLHAGWRGAAGGILARGVELLRGRAGSRLQDLLLHLGPAICGRCYEVGPEVLEAFGLPAEAPGPWHLDLRTQVLQEAARLGIEQRTVSPWCTAHDRPRFYSHRASAGRDGRMVAYLGWPASGPSGAVSGPGRTAAPETPGSPSIDPRRPAP